MSEAERVRRAMLEDMRDADSIKTIADLTPDPANARRHNPRNVGMIERSLNEVGAARSIVIDEAGTVLAGNGLIEAAAQAGIERVRVVEADGNEIIAVRRRGLTDEQKVKLALYDNRTNELSDWDAGVLAEIAQEHDLSALFTSDELAALLEDVQVEPGAGGDDFDTTPEDGPTRAQLGDLWVIGGVHRLFVGDCTGPANVARLMGGERAGAVVTDSPYGIDRDGIENDDPEGLRGLFDRLLSSLPCDNAVVINCQSPRLFPAWIDSLRDCGHKFERALWYVETGANSYPWRGWMMKGQIILVSTIGKGAWPKDPPIVRDTYSINFLIQNLGELEQQHTTIKPIELIQSLVEHTTGHVYDPFLGSGTTLIAAHRTGRRCYGMEISPRYADVILRRAEAEGLECDRIDG